MCLKMYFLFAKCIRSTYLRIYVKLTLNTKYKNLMSQNSLNIQMLELLDFYIVYDWCTVSYLIFWRTTSDKARTNIRSRLVLRNFVALHNTYNIVMNTHLNT